MNGTFIIKITTDFAAAHRLRGHEGPCARLHGHNWKIAIEFKATTLNEIGIAVDFSEVKAIAHNILDPLDHQYLNELAPFDEINPTAENLAYWLYQQLESKIEQNDVTMHAVHIWETDHACVTYSES